MTDEQPTLGDVLDAEWSGQDETETESEENTGDGASQFQLLADNAEPWETDSCPWCCGPAEDFVTHEDGRVGCTNCDAVVPIDADWYQDGEKVVLR